MTDEPDCSDEYVGSDCPFCKSKGTIFRSINPDGGTDFIQCLFCRYPSVSEEGLVYPPGHPREITVPEEMFGPTPVISKDLLTLVGELHADRYRLHQIRKAIWPDMPSHAEKEIPQTVMKLE